ARQSRHRSSPGNIVTPTRLLFIEGSSFWREVGPVLSFHRCSDDDALFSCGRGCLRLPPACEHGLRTDRPGRHHCRTQEGEEPQHRGVDRGPKAARRERTPRQGAKEIPLRLPEGGEGRSRTRQVEVTSRAPPSASHVSTRFLHANRHRLRSKTLWREG